MHDGSDVAVGAATLSERLGLEGVVNESVWLGYRTPGASLPGRKVMTLVHGMLAGADSIDDMDVLRAGATQLVVAHALWYGDRIRIDRELLAILRPDIRGSALQRLKYGDLVRARVPDPHHRDQDATPRLLLTQPSSCVRDRRPDPTTAILRPRTVALTSPLHDLVSEMAPAPQGKDPTGHLGGAWRPRPVNGPAVASAR